MHKFTIRGQGLSRTSFDRIVSDTVNYLEFSFSFTPDWDGIPKYANFQLGMGTPHTVEIVDGIISSDKQVNLSAGSWSLKVVGLLMDGATVVKRVVTGEITLNVDASNLQDGETFPNWSGEVGAETLAQVTAALASIDSALETIDDVYAAKEAAETAQAAAESAKSGALSAQGGAVGAMNTSVAAKNAAEIAKASAESANISAQQAKETAESAAGNAAGEVSAHNANMNAHADLVALITAKRYGVRFDGSASNGTRLFDAAGMSAAVGTGSTPAFNDFDSILPWSGMRRCNTILLNGERVPTYFEGEAGYSNTAADVFVYVPLFYYFRSDDDSRHVVSMTPLSGYRAPSKFVRGDGSLRNYVFLPAYTAGLVGGVPVSRSGYYPHITSLNGWMTLLAAKHTDDTLADDVWIESMKDDEIECILMDIEFATRDHQTVMMSASNMRYATDQTTVGGVNQFTVSTAAATAMAVGQAIAIGTTNKGAEVADNATILTINTTTGAITFAPAGADVTVSIGNYISSRPWKSGACDGVVAPSGSPVSNTSGIYPCKYRGIENPYGNQHRWRWDYLQNNHAPSVLLDPTKYAAGSITSDYKALSYTVPTSDGYVTVMGYDPAYPFARATNAVGGGSTTYFADYFSQSTGVRAVSVGGYVGSGRYAGARCCSASGAPSGSYWSIGAALSPA